MATGLVGVGAYAALRAKNRYGRDAEDRMRDHRVTLAAQTPRMVLTEGQNPTKNVEAVLAALGGMGTFVKRGEIVLVKPNIGWDSSAAMGANTHPLVVAAVVRACRQAGAGEVIVTDCPVDDPERTFAVSGIKRAAEEAGAKVVLPHELPHRSVKLSDRLGVWDVFQPFLQADRIINVPVVKHHGGSRVTAGMKNWIGITLRSRAEFHASLDQSIAELALLMRPTLTILDASRILIRNGPKGGNLDDIKQKNQMAAGVDPVALDAWATELLGVKTDQVTYLRLAEKMKLGKMDYRSLSPRELTTT